MLEEKSGTSNAHLTEAQRRYVAAEKHFSEVVKPALAELRDLKTAVVQETGLGTYFQDEEGIVYHTASKSGTWVDFTPFEIQRTRRPGEAKGTLSLKEAKEAGFVLNEG